MTMIATRTLAFLFTDVEGSTRLWEQHPDGMRVALAQHDRILDGLLEIGVDAVYSDHVDRMVDALGRLD